MANNAQPSACLKCGAQAAPGWTVCPYCGTNIIAGVQLRPIATAPGMCCPKCKSNMTSAYSCSYWGMNMLVTGCLGVIVWPLAPILSEARRFTDVTYTYQCHACSESWDHTEPKVRPWAISSKVLMVLLSLAFLCAEILGLKFFYKKLEPIIDRINEPASIEQTL